VRAQSLFYHALAAGNLFHVSYVTFYNSHMSEPLVVRKEVIVKEDGRIVILYSFVRAAESPPPSPVRRGARERAVETPSVKSTQESATT
jgi:hypothetical protein